MLRKESIDQKYHNLQITSSLEFESLHSNSNKYQTNYHDDDVILENEEDSNYDPSYNNNNDHRGKKIENI